MPEPGREPRAHSRLLRRALPALLLALLASFVRADFDSEYNRAARTLLCDCGCSPQSVHECACGRAAQMRDEIAAKIRGGKTGQQILDEAVAAQGEKVLIAPPASGFNVVAWLGPIAALLLGIAGVALLARRWRKPAPAAPEETPTAAPADEAYLARLEREVRELL